MAGLDTPSLRELHILAMRFSSTVRVTCHIPSLSKFIRVGGIFFLRSEIYDFSVISHDFPVFMSPFNR